MAPPKVVSGARAIVSVTPGDNTAGIGTAATGAGSGKPVVVGIFNNFSYQVMYGAQPAFILGSFVAAEIDYTHVEPVSCSATGWRVVDHGIFIDPALPTISQLLTIGTVTLTVKDRVDGRTIANISGVRPTGASGGFAARQLAEQTSTYIGLLFDDESTTGTGAQTEVTRADLP